MVGRMRAAARAGAAVAVLVGGGVVGVTVSPGAAQAACSSGGYRQQVRGYLSKIGYGTDCAGVTRFQQRFGIRPAGGQADATTYDVAKRLAATDPAACKAKPAGITFCVDLTHQTTWVMKNGTVLVAPTIARTGKKGYRTPAGTFSINKRTKKEWSDPYHVWLPYWQRFVGGRGFHQTTTYIHDKWRGSHGCVNLLPQDAKTYYGLGKLGATVKVFGRRPGT